MAVKNSWDPVWEQVFQQNEWGKYPAESLIRFIARNFYDKNRQTLKILEIGCGPGANIWYLSREKFHAYGVDGSETAIKRARQRLDAENIRAELFQRDIMDLSIFESNFFDAVIDVECLSCNSFMNTQKILNEVKRVLKTNGLFYSRTFSEKMLQGKDASGVSDLEYSEVKEGPLKGKGFLRLSDKKSIDMLYGSLFSIKSIDTLEFSNNNETDFVSEYIIIAQKV